MNRILLGLLISLLCIAPLVAQDSNQFNQGFYGYRNYDTTPVDAIDPSTGALMIHIPLVSYPQRGKLPPITIYLRSNSFNWYDVDAGYGDCCGEYYYWQAAGFPGVTVEVSPSLQESQATYIWGYDPYGNPEYYDQYWVEDDTGAVHDFDPNLNYTVYATSDGSNYVAAATQLDGSGLSYGGGSTPGAKGAFYGSVSDPNGNSMPSGFDVGAMYTDTTYTYGGTIVGTDSIGRIFQTNSSAVVPSGPGCYPMNLPGANGGTLTFTLCYSNRTIVSPYKSDPYYTPYNATLTLLTQVILPANSQGQVTHYDFSYDQFGDITSITLPTGGVITYGWMTGPFEDFPNDSFAPYVQTRTVNANDGNPSRTWTYSQTKYCANDSSQSGIVTDPEGNDTARDEVGGGPQYYGKRTRYYQGACTGGGAAPLKTVVNYYTESQQYSLFPSIISATWPSGQTSQVVYTYDNANGNQLQKEQGYGSSYFYSLYKVVEKDEYDYGQGAPGALLRRTTTNYLWQTNTSYFNSNILDSPVTTTVYDVPNNNAQVAQTVQGYDDSSRSPGCVCGNNTSTTHWLNTGASPIIYVNYNSQGMPVSTTDGRGNVTTTTYDSTGLYPSQIQYPTTGGVQHIETYTYEPITGLMTSQTDENNQPTSYQYDYATRRVTQISYPDGGQVNYTYYDTPPNPYFVFTQKITASANLTEEGIMDGLGRPIHTQLQSDPDGTDYTDTTYDDLGRVASVSNPYRSTSDSTYGVVSYQYDSLNRTTKVTDQDGSFGSTSYAGPCATQTDEAGKTRESCTDGLGRLTTVVENPGGLNYTTSYNYDALDNLTGVTQVGSHQRSFTYDSLSRLTSAYNPESGTTGYSYDANGNLITKTDARGIVITNAYDALNRLTQKTYSDQSEIATYGYDVSTQFGVSFANPVGRMVYEKLDYPGSGPQNSTWSTFSYDQMGRIASQGNCFPSPIAQCQSFWTVNANHDLLGDLISLMYPDGRVVKTYNNGAARPTQVTFDNFNGTSVNYNYLSAAHYTPDGSPASTLMGNGVSETSTYNSRLQPCNQQIATGTSNWVNRTYSFYLSGACTGSSGNNGNVMNIADNLQSGRTQAFAYDALNRLAVAHTWATSGPDCWGNSYVYDQWANLTQQNVSQCSAPYMNLSIDGNNHITNTGFAYDAAGNLTLNSPISYQYDAENRLVNYASGAGIYTYDAEGNRVQKQAGGVTADYIYFGGQPIAEYNPTTQDWSDYIYAGSRRLARADSYENGIWIQGTNDGSSNWPNTWFRLNDANYLSGTYTIQAGDYLYERQYQDNARGGMGLFFRDGTNNAWQSTDQYGNYINDDPNQVVWDERSFNLTAFAGKVVDWVGIDTDAHTPPGAWSVVYGDIVIVSADGTVHPIYSASANFSASLEWATGSTGVSVTNRHISNVGWATFTTTNYYHGDHLGSERLVTGYNGYPTWSATFLPFGEEWNPQPTVNHYKFTAKERDSESGLDNFGARYDSSQLGRFMSPDPGNAGAAPANPQSWNMYSYVINNPLNAIDPNGLWCVWEDGTHDDDPNQGGENEAQCQSDGGHWDNSDTIFGIFTNEDGDVTGYRTSGGYFSFAGFSQPVTLAAFDLALDYSNNPNQPTISAMPQDCSLSGRLSGAMNYNPKVGFSVELDQVHAELGGTYHTNTQSWTADAGASAYGVGPNASRLLSYGNQTPSNTDASPQFSFDTPVSKTAIPTLKTKFAPSASKLVKLGGSFVVGGEAEFDSDVFARTGETCSQ